MKFSHKGAHISLCCSLICGLMCCSIYVCEVSDTLLDSMAASIQYCVVVRGFSDVATYGMLPLQETSRIVLLFSVAN